MSLYGHKGLYASEDSSLQGIDLTPFIEDALYDDISRADSDTIQRFIHSEAAQILMEKNVLSKPTMMRLSKADDEKRRIKLAAYRLARQANDPNWKKMVFHRKKWKEYRDKVLVKFANKSKVIAKASQREYIKNARKGNLPSASKNKDEK